MRESCKGCVHRRRISSSIPHETCCHYLLDLNITRDCLPEECKYLGKYTAKNSKKGKAILGRSFNESWDFSTMYLGKKHTKSLKDMERFD